MFSRTTRAALALAAFAALAQQRQSLADVDGSVAGKGLNPWALQSTPTGFGNNSNELDGVYGKLTSTGDLNFVVTGNLSDGNGFCMFLDSRAGGCATSAGTITTALARDHLDDWGTTYGGGPYPTDGGPSVLPAGFNPEFATDSNTYQGTLYTDAVNMTLNNTDGDADHYIGAASQGSGGSYAFNHWWANGTISIGFNGNNTQGINGTGDPAGDPTTATTGMEFNFSSAALNATPGQDIKLMGFITNGGGYYLSNQFLPGLPGNPGNLGGATSGTHPLFKATDFAGYAPLTIEQPAWQGGSGSWSAANWGLRVSTMDGSTTFATDAPNGTNTTAKFTSAVTTAATITLDAPKTVGALVFNTPNKVTVAGTDTLTFDTYGQNALLQVVQGSHEISAPVAFAKNTTVDVANNGTLLISSIIQAPAINISKTGTGVLVATSIRANTLSVAPGGIVTIAYSAPATPPDADNDANNGNDGHVSILKNLNLGLSGASLIDPVTGLPPTALSTLDLKNNDLIVDSQGGQLTLADGTTQVSAIDYVRAAVAAAYDGASWDLKGITSSTAVGSANKQGLGVITGQEYLDLYQVDPMTPTLFDGVAVTADMVLVKYTWAGDANFDGVEDTSDLSALSGGLGSNPVKDWTTGDFNYDGSVDTADLSVLSGSINNFGHLPEPTGLGALALGVGALLKRRRRVANPESRI